MEIEPDVLLLDAFIEINIIVFYIEVWKEFKHDNKISSINNINYIV